MTNQFVYTKALAMSGGLDKVDKRRHKCLEIHKLDAVLSQIKEIDLDAGYHTPYAGHWHISILNYAMVVAYHML